jgi:hypothetical protein
VPSTAFVQEVLDISSILDATKGISTGNENRASLETALGRVTGYTIAKETAGTIGFVGAALLVEFDGVSCADLPEGALAKAKVALLAQFEAVAVSDGAILVTYSAFCVDSGAAGARHRRQAGRLTIQLELVYRFEAAGPAELAAARARVAAAITANVADTTVSIDAGVGGVLTATVSTSTVEEVAFANILDALVAEAKIFNFDVVCECTSGGSGKGFKEGRVADAATSTSAKSGKAAKSASDSGESEMRETSGSGDADQVQARGEAGDVTSGKSKKGKSGKAVTSAKSSKGMKEAKATQCNCLSSSAKTGKSSKGYRTASTDPGSGVTSAKKGKGSSTQAAGFSAIGANMADNKTGLVTLSSAAVLAVATAAAVLFAKKRSGGQLTASAVAPTEATPMLV